MIKLNDLKVSLVKCIPILVNNFIIVSHALPPRPGTFSESGNLALLILN